MNEETSKAGMTSILHQESQLHFPQTTSIDQDPIIKIKLQSPREAYLTQEQKQFIVDLRKQDKRQSEIIKLFKDQFNRTIASSTISYWAVKYNLAALKKRSIPQKISHKINTEMHKLINTLYKKNHLSIPRIEATLKQRYGWSPVYTSIRYHLMNPPLKNSKKRLTKSFESQSQPLNSSELAVVLKYKALHRSHEWITNYLSTKHNICISIEQLKEILRLNTLPKKQLSISFLQRIKNSFKAFTTELKRS